MSTGDVKLLRAEIMRSSATTTEKETILALTRRSQNPNIVRGKVDARPVTAELRDQVKAYKAAHPEKNLRNIGRAFSIDGGRVSEILAGEWDHL